MIISLFGPDGVGKSTHADVLAYELAKQGYKIKRVWVKNNHTIAYLIITMLTHISKNNVVFLPSKTILTNILASSSRFSKKLWLWIDAISTLIKLVVSVHIPLLLGYTVIADRYIPDTIVAMTLTVRSIRIIKEIPVKLLLSILRKNKNIIIMLDCDYGCIKARRKALVEPKPIISWQRLVFKVLAGILNAPLVRTDKDLRKTHSEIFKLVNQSLHNDS